MLNNNPTQIIPLSPDEARLALWDNVSSHILVMCRGYNDEDDVFTELVWEEDWELDFHDNVSYPEFQLWVFEEVEKQHEAT